MKAFILSLPLLLAACASTTTRATRPEPLRITASHYETMGGVTMTSDNDLVTTCRRDIITGSHVVRWYCSFAGDPTQFQLDRHIVLASVTGR